MNPEKLVLIADDDDSIVRVLTVRCRNLGLGVVAAHDGVGAIEMLQERRPDLALLDANMPNGDAFTVCQRLASEDHLPWVPVLILTGETDQKVMQECLRYGAFYVPKSPYLWQTIKPMIGRLLRISKAAS